MLSSPHVAEYTMMFEKACETGKADSEKIDGKV